ILRAIARPAAVDSAFEKSLADARQMAAQRDENFVDLFYEALQKRKENVKLADYFYGPKTGLGLNDPNGAYLDKLREEAKSAVENTLTVLRQRIDAYGVASPNIQSQGNGRIIVELPGVRDQERVADLLRKTAKLEFWPTWSYAEAQPSILRINEKVKEIAKAEGLMNDDAEKSDEPADFDPLGADPLGDQSDADPLGDQPEDDQTETADAEETEADDEADDEADADAEETQEDDQTEATDEADAEADTQEDADPLAGAGDEDDDTTDKNENSLEEFNKDNPFFKLLKQPMQAQNSQIVQGFRAEQTSVVGYAQPADTAKINYWLRREEIKRLIPATMKFLWTAKAVEVDNETDALKDHHELIAIKTNRQDEAPLTGEYVTETGVNVNNQTSQVEVLMRMDGKGAKIWSKLTKENIKKDVAVALDGLVYSHPVVQDQISGGSTQITGNFDLEEAQDLANILKAGKLPAPARIEGEEYVGPTLGAQTVSKGFISFIGGFIAVILFMLLYYKRVGLIADVALLINLFFVMGVMSALNVVLTLPGIAGIVLSMGMAVDANVLIYERIREELRAGKSIKDAINSGFQNALSAIVDGNITTFLTGVILFSFGVGPIKGFAVTLMIGIATTLISALLVTRFILEWVANRPNAKALTFGDNAVTRRFDNMKRAFVDGRKTAYIVAGVIAIGSVVMFTTQGFRLGVDLEGGRQYRVEFSENQPPAEEVSSVLAGKFENKTPVVRTVGGENEYIITTNYLADVSGEGAEAADEKVQTRLLEGLAQFGVEKTDLLGATKVGPTIAKDIQNAAISSVIFALVVIFLYVFIRFRYWQYGLGALSSLTFNVLVVLGIFSVLGKFDALPFSVEIDQSIIAALLTIVGYTINDTVVVFDRIREVVRDDKT
ncbi:MAG: protein translocase subunit SecD, partial [Bacteroidota bacterium]